MDDAALNAIASGVTSGNMNPQVLQDYVKERSQDEGPGGAIRRQGADMQEVRRQRLQQEIQYQQGNARYAATHGGTKQGASFQAAPGGPTIEFSGQQAGQAGKLAGEMRGNYETSPEYYRGQAAIKAMKNRQLAEQTAATRAYQGSVGPMNDSQSVEPSDAYGNARLKAIAGGAEGTVTGTNQRTPAADWAAMGMADPYAPNMQRQPQALTPQEQAAANMSAGQVDASRDDYTNVGKMVENKLKQLQAAVPGSPEARSLRVQLDMLRKTQGVMAEQQTPPAPQAQPQAQAQQTPSKTAPMDRAMGGYEPPGGTAMRANPSPFASGMVPERVPTPAFPTGAPAPQFEGPAPANPNQDLYDAYNRAGGGQGVTHGQQTDRTQSPAMQAAQDQLYAGQSAQPLPAGGALAPEQFGNQVSLNAMPAIQQQSPEDAHQQYMDTLNSDIDYWTKQFQAAGGVMPGEQPAQQQPNAWEQRQQLGLDEIRSRIAGAQADTAGKVGAEGRAAQDAQYMQGSRPEAAAVKAATTVKMANELKASSLDISTKEVGLKAAQAALARDPQNAELQRRVQEATIATEGAKTRNLDATTAAITKQAGVMGDNPTPQQASVAASTAASIRLGSPEPTLIEGANAKQWVDTMKSKVEKVKKALYSLPAGPARRAAAASLMQTEDFDTWVNYNPEMGWGDVATAGVTSGMSLAAKMGERWAKPVVDDLVNTVRSMASAK
jgi:hypothetical protein